MNGWGKVIGQHAIVRRLQGAIVRKRVPHALLFSGDDGSGTLALAIAYAQVVNCETPVFGVEFVGDVDHPTIDACGLCRSCLQSSTLQHPDVRIVVSLPAGKADTEADLPDEIVEELSDQFRAVANDPYETLSLPNASLIRISQIRELKRTLSLSSTQGGHRVVIIHHADEMNVEASNAFLKTLEEPHADVTIILTTQQPERLLATISSRCQEIFLPPLPDETIVAYLKQHHDCTDAEAWLVAQFAEGSIVRARTFLASDVNEERTEAVELLRSALKGREYRLGLTEAIQRVADTKDRNKAVRMLTLMSLWLRDAQSTAARNKTDLVSNIDQVEALTRFASAFGAADFGLALTILENAARDIRRNVSINLVLLTALLEIRHVLYAARTMSTEKAA